MYKEIGKKLTEKNRDKIREQYQLDKGEKKEKNGGVPKGEMPDFAKAIKHLRAEADLSLENLAVITGINKQTLHSIENYSIRNPSFANLEKIASALKVTLNDLLLMARGEFAGNFFKTTAAERWIISFELEKGFSVLAYSPPTASQRDFFTGVMTIQPNKKLKYWQFTAHSKVCIQPWDGEVLFAYHGMNWRKEVRLSANETLYFDASIPHSFENLSDKANRVLIVTYPSIF